LNSINKAQRNQRSGAENGSKMKKETASCGVADNESRNRSRNEKKVRPF